jgi:hypothetical protein
MIDDSKKAFVEWAATEGYCLVEPSLYEKHFISALRESFQAAWNHQQAKINIAVEALEEIEKIHAEAVAYCKNHAELLDVLRPFTFEMRDRALQALAKLKGE